MQHWAAFVNLNARPNKHNGGPLRSQPSLRVSAKWSTRSSKDIGGQLSSLPSYIDTHYAYSTSSNGQHWAASVNLNTSQVKTMEDRYVPSRAWVRLQSGVPLRQRNGGPFSQQSLEVYAMWSIRSSKHFGGASGSHSTLAAPAKWSTRSGKEIGGPLNSQPNLEVCRVEHPPGKDL